MTDIEYTNVKSLINKGQYILAQKKIIGLINDEPNNLSYKNLLAFIYVNQKKYKDSIIVLNNIIKQSPNFIDAYVNLGSIYNDLNQLQNAEDCFKQAISINSSHLLALYSLANVYDKQSKHEEASEIYSRLIIDDPGNLELLNDYSSNLIKLGNLNKAKQILNEILNLNSKHIGAIINLGVVYKEEKNLEKAIQYFSLALKLKPNLSIAYYNLGTVYENQEQFGSAVTYYKKAIKSNPNYVGAHYNLGCVLDKIGQITAAIFSYKETLIYNPQHRQAQYNLARDQLATDDFENGWKGYELRWGGDIKKHYEKLGIPKDMIWDGGKFKGPLVVHAEQGLGDEILYSSMFSNLLKYHTNLFISLDNRLISLYQRSFPKISFIDRKKKFNVNKYSKHILAGSLGMFFRNSLNDFKNNKKPWLIPSQKESAKIKNNMPFSKKIKVGISWKSPAYIDKNISLIKLLSILPDKYFEIINLQYGDIYEEKKMIEELELKKIFYFDDFDYKNDQEGLSVLINNCDFIISVSNSTVHLSGALGKLTYVLIPTKSPWYWHNGRKHCLWYPNVLLYKQSIWRKWDEPLARLENDIRLKYKL